MNDYDSSNKNLLVGLTQAVQILVGIATDFGYRHVGESPSGANCYMEYNKPGKYDNEVDNFNLKASCIVGQVFSRLGILRALFIDSAKAHQYSVCESGSPLWDNAERFGVTFSEDARVFLRMVQQRQDDGTVWGDAIHNALDEFHADKREVLEGQHRKAMLALTADQSIEKDALDALPRQAEPLADWEKELLNGSME